MDSGPSSSSQIAAASRALLCTEPAMQHQVFEEAVLHVAERRPPAPRAARCATRNRAPDRPRRAAPAFPTDPCRSSTRNRAEQLGKLEGFRDVVVGAAVEAAHHVLCGVAGGQDQDRRLRATRAETPADLDPTDLREAEIENDGIVVPRRGEPQCLLAVGGVVDGVAFVAEPDRERSGEPLLILDEEEPGHDQRCARWTTRLPTIRGSQHGCPCPAIVVVVVVIVVVVVVAALFLGIGLGPSSAESGTTLPGGAVEVEFALLVAARRARLCSGAPRSSSRARRGQDVPRPTPFGLGDEVGAR